MKRLFIVFLLVFLSAGSSFALDIHSDTAYTQYARNRAKYYPQNSFANRYRRSQNQNYIFSPQQARYYGYRVPNQTGTFNSPYYNRYPRGRY